MTESGYGLGESLIAAVVQKASGFSAANVARGDWKCLNSGKAAVYAILTPEAAGKRTWDGHNRVTEPFVTTVQIWQQYIKDGTTLTQLEANTDVVLILLDQYRLLGDTSGYVQMANASINGLPQEMWTKSGGPAWLRWDITVSWQGKRIITFAE
jgi:hypothetical protein